jgi:hypothetical protein
VLDGVRDESSKDAPVRLVFEPKTRTIEQQELITSLLAHTSLESSSSINLTMVGLDGRPVPKTLRQMLEEWIAFQANHGAAAFPIPLGQGACAHPHFGRPPVGVAQHRRGDSHHPPQRRT